MRSLMSKVAFCVVLGGGAALALGGCGGKDPSGLFADDAGLPWDAGEDGPNDAGGSGDAGDASTDAGGPNAVVTAKEIDFGPSECGGTAPATRTLEVQNAGAAPLTWSASLDVGTHFSITGAKNGTIAPGEKASLVVSAKPIPATATAGAVQLATLTLTTNDPAHPTIDVKVKTTATGGHLTVTPVIAGFGLIPVGQQATDIDIALKNTGNAPVTIAFGQPPDNQFALTWTGAPGTVTLAPGNEVPGLKARFKPTVMTASSTSATLVVTGAVCGASATSIAMSGQGSVGAISLTPSVIDFGKTDCGTTSGLGAAQRTVTITNTGNASFTWTAALAKGASSPYTLTTDSTTLAPGETGTVTVNATAIPGTSSTADNAFGDTLKITTDIPSDSLHEVDIRQTASGVILKTTPASLAFGNVKLPGTSKLSFTITNEGNAPAPGLDVVITGDGKDAYAAKTTTFGTLAAGETTTPDEVTFSPSSTATATAKAEIQVTGSPALCAPLPAVALTGTGTNGILVLSTTSIPFGQRVDNTVTPPMGLANCGSTPGAKTFEVSNIGNAPFTFDATLRSGTHYTLSGHTNVTVEPGKSKTVTVTPGTIPSNSAITSNLYGDIVDVVPQDIYGDPGNHTVALRMTAYGAILAPVANIDFGDVVVGASADMMFSVTNNGNGPALLDFDVKGGEFSITGAPQTIPENGGLATFVAYFTPTSAGAQDTKVELHPTGGSPMCGPVPGPFQLTGNGVEVDAK